MSPLSVTKIMLLLSHLSTVILSQKTAPVQTTSLSPNATISGCCDEETKPFCREGCACCPDGSWGNSIGDAYTFVCNGVQLQQGSDTFGEICSDPCCHINDRPNCKEGCQCCPDGTWTVSIGDAKTYYCNGEMLVEGSLTKGGATFGEICPTTYAPTLDPTLLLTTAVPTTNMPTMAPTFDEHSSMEVTDEFGNPLVGGVHEPNKEYFLDKYMLWIIVGGSIILCVIVWVVLFFCCNKRVKSTAESENNGLMSVDVTAGNVQKVTSDTGSISAVNTDMETAETEMINAGENIGDSENESEVSGEDMYVNDEVIITPQNEDINDGSSEEEMYATNEIRTNGEFVEDNSDNENMYAKPMQNEPTPN